jgi:hypothetical protein
MVATASFPPFSSVDTLSQTSMIYSQFSDVRFSSVALAMRSKCQYHPAKAAKDHIDVTPGLTLTDDIVKGVLLCPEHDSSEIWMLREDKESLKIQS